MSIFAFYSLEIGQFMHVATIQIVLSTADSWTF